MAFLYHMVPPAMDGHVLYPLNELKAVRPDLYKEEMAKYEGREGLLARRVEPLDCLWNDVVHLSPIEPSLVKAARAEAGSPVSKSWSFYRIDAASLDPARTIVYLSALPLADGKIDPRDYVPFDPATVGRYGTVPEATKVYYRRMAAEGKRPLMYAWAPHVFYRGKIDVSGCEIVTV